MMESFINNKEIWYLWIDTEHSPMMNMGIDEALLAEVKKESIPLLRIYDWDRPSVSIGYVQDYSAAPQSGYTIVRRPTGGGVVFHDVDMTYTVVIPAGHWIERESRLESYHVFHRILIDALGKLNINSELVNSEIGPVNRSTMQCFSSPTRYDVVTNSANKEAKVAGAAQRRTKNGILHQGSIVIEDISSKKQRLIEALLSAFRIKLNIEFKDYKPSESLIGSATILAEKKYSKDSWNKYRKIDEQ